MQPDTLHQFDTVSNFHGKETLFHRMSHLLLVIVINSKFYALINGLAIAHVLHTTVVVLETPEVEY